MAQQYSFHKALTNWGAPKKSSSTFNKKLSNGTSIFGDKRLEKYSFYKHGHSGNNFHRPPYNAMAKIATGQRTGYNHHKKNNTSRW